MRIKPYIPRKLMENLTRATENKAAILVAPTGYGKSTAVKVFESALGQRFFYAASHWDNLEADFEEICQLVALFDTVSAKKLQEEILDPFSQHSHLASIIKEAKTKSEEAVYVVLDDIHLLRQDTHPSLLDAFLTHTDKNLHYILLGQPFVMPSLRFDPYSVYWVGASSLALEQEDIKALFDLNACPLGKDEAQEIYKATQGWPAAVSASLARKLEQKETDYVLVTQRLVSQVCLERLDKPVQNLLMGLALMDHPSQKDAAALDPGFEENLALRNALIKVPLLLADSVSLTYELHDTLRSLLQRRLINSDEKTRNCVYTALGRHLAYLDQLTQAIHCFYLLKDYEAILGLNLRLLSFSLIGSTPFEEVAAEIAEHCKQEAVQKHPIGFLRLGYFLFAAGDLVGYHRVLSRAEPVCDKETKPDLYGEWLIISMLQHLPDIPKMHEVVREAAKYLKGPARAISSEEPFLFGAPSMLYVFYRAPGQGDQVALQMESWLIDYDRLFSRRGCGAVMLYKGELASMRCQFELSNTCLNSALSQGEDALQPTVVYGCALLMARNAIANKDEEGVDKALSTLLASSALFTKLAETALYKAIYQTVLVMILSMLREVGMKKDAYAKGLSVPRNDSILMQITVHVRVLEMLYQGEEERALGLMQSVLQRSSRLHNTITEYVVSLALAIYFWHTGQKERALDLAHRSLTIAREDELYSLYVNHWDLISPILKDEHLSAFAHFTKKVEGIQKCLQKQDAQKQTREMDQLPDTLTEREREVAILAAQGFTNPEIAKELFVTESTVKKHMLIIFRKMSIKRRAKLISLLNSEP